MLSWTYVSILIVLTLSLTSCTERSKRDDEEDGGGDAGGTGDTSWQQDSAHKLPLYPGHVGDPDDSSKQRDPYQQLPQHPGYAKQLDVSSDEVNSARIPRPVQRPQHHAIPSQTRGLPIQKHPNQLQTLPRPESQVSQNIPQPFLRKAPARMLPLSPWRNPALVRQTKLQGRPNMFSQRSPAIPTNQNQPQRPSPRQSVDQEPNSASERVDSSSDSAEDQITSDKTQESKIATSNSNEDDEDSSELVQNSQQISTVAEIPAMLPRRTPLKRMTTSPAPLPLVTPRVYRPAVTPRRFIAREYRPVLIPKRTTQRRLVVTPRKLFTPSVYHPAKPSNNGFARRQRPLLIRKPYRPAIPQQKLRIPAATPLTTKPSQVPLVPHLAAPVSPEKLNPQSESSEEDGPDSIDNKPNSKDSEENTESLHQQHMPLYPGQAVAPAHVPLYPGQVPQHQQGDHIAPSIPSSSSQEHVSGGITSQEANHRTLAEDISSGEDTGSDSGQDKGGNPLISSQSSEEVSDESRESDEDDDSEEGSYHYYHPPSRPVCPSLADVIIMLDGSDSLTEGNFHFGKQVIDQIISKLYLNPRDGFAVGAMIFSDSIQEYRLRPFKDNVYLRSLLMNSYQEMGGTGTDYVLYNMRRLFISEGRRGIPKIGVLMTDGRSRNPATAIEQARMARNEGVHLITVALGVVTNPLELRAISSDPNSVIRNPSASSVITLIQRYAAVSCQAPPTYPVYTLYPPVKIPYPPLQTPFPPVNTPRPPLFTPYPPVRTPSPPLFTPYPPVRTPSPPLFTPYPPVRTPFPPVRTTYPPILTPFPPVVTPFPPVRTPFPPVVTPLPPTRRGPCDDCKFLNGIGYNPHESVCSFYYQCFNNNGVLVPYQRTCAFGLFWDQVDLTCKPAASVDCASDPCKRSPRSYGASGNCRAYWQCRWGRTISAQCCSYSHRFDSIQGCVFDRSCTVACPPNQPVQPGVCNLRPYPQDPTQYYEDIGQGREILRRCALGSAFVPAPACRCDRRTTVDPRPWECKADLYLPFNDDLRDKSGQQLEVFADRVSIDRSPAIGAIGGGAARFNGDGRLLVWKYANDDFGSKFVIRLRYRALPATNSSRNEGLVTNSDCMEPCSVAISYNRQGNSTSAKIRTAESGVVRTVIGHKSGWNDVEYKYDGSNLSFNVNGNIQSLRVSGNIAKVPAALQIGTGCMGYDPFTGYIDELYIYKCIP